MISLLKPSLFVGLIVAVSSNAFAASNCDKPFTDHMSEVQCIAQAKKDLDDQLNQAYQAALKVRLMQDQRDTRKNQEQLRKSQRAWLKYREENCALVGGLQGGNNLWVTQFVDTCESKETKSRIGFLTRVAKGEFGG
jgi:uncharacterized protein YecT (DUF1311 family)